MEPFERSIFDGDEIGLPEAPAAACSELALELRPALPKRVGQGKGRISVRAHDPHASPRSRRSLVDEEDHLHQRARVVGPDLVVHLRLEEAGPLVEPAEPDHVLLELDGIEGERARRGDQWELAEQTPDVIERAAALDRKLLTELDG